ncbi:ribosomal protein S18-alanine N-acetyltransferase [Methyloparacoccus murrellii]
MDAFLDLLDRARRWLRYDAETEFYYKHFPSLVENAELILRPMVRSDITLLAAIEASAYEFPWELETFRSCFKIGYHCWVGERAREVVCYGISTIGAGESHVLNVCVAPAWQGQGYGRIVLQKLIDEAARLRADSMFLEVRPSNPNAIRLYRSLGFNEIGTRKDYYPARHGREDALVMARVLG